MQNNIYSVTQVNKYIKTVFATDFMLNHLEVRGEVSNLRCPEVGHVYFTLKDAGGAIRCVMFASNRGGLKFKLKDGMAIVVKGSCSVYERDGSYQIYVREIRQEGVGTLFEEFEKLKARLEEQGMFDPLYKQQIPSFVRTLGVVTAPNGAAVRDIIDVSKRRNPGIQIILYPAVVQGDECPASVVRGIKALENYGVDVIIVGRGGGSIEDLWGFNDETVAQAIFDCSIPIISAVGHETDFTIADFVSDLRAPTPSAAAELAVKDIREPLARIEGYKQSLSVNMNRAIWDAKKNSAHISKRLYLLSPKAKLADRKKQLERLKADLNDAISGKLTTDRHRLQLLAGRLEGQSPITRLSGGFSFVERGGGQAVKHINEVSVGDELKIYVTDGTISATVTGTEDNQWTKKQ